MKLKEFRIESDRLDENLEVEDIIYEYELKRDFRYRGKSIQHNTKENLEDCLILLNKYIDYPFDRTCPMPLKDCHIIKAVIEFWIKN